MRIFRWGKPIEYNLKQTILDLTDGDSPLTNPPSRSDEINGWGIVDGYPQKVAGESIDGRTYTNIPDVVREQFEENLFEHKRHNVRTCNFGSALLYEPTEEISFDYEDDLTAGTGLTGNSDVTVRASTDDTSEEIMERVAQLTDDPIIEDQLENLTEELANERNGDRQQLMLYLDGREVTLSIEDREFFTIDDSVFDDVNGGSIELSTNNNY